MRTTLYEPPPTYPFIREIPERLGGANRKTTFEDSSGRRWLFKFQSDDITLVDVVTSAIAERAGVPSPTIYAGNFDFNEQPYRGSLQPRLNFIDLRLSRSLAELSDAQREVLQCHQVVDWLLGNPDTHRGQFLVLPDDTLVGVDKAQSMRLFPHDRLQWESLLYPLNNRRSVYD